MNHIMISKYHTVEIKFYGSRIVCSLRPILCSKNNETIRYSTL